jgi:hypothetical protein
MNPILRNILAVIAGWIGGSVVNMVLIQIGYSMYPIEGIDPNDMEALAEIMPTLGKEHFIFPFLAHALGTLVGATIAAMIAVGQKMKVALIIGAIFLLGGIAVSFMLPGPTWFTAVDLILAYLPMAWFGGKFAERLERVASGNETGASSL